MLKVGDKLVGVYKIEALLGEGGMGAVFRAFDTFNKRMVAIKEFRLGDLLSEDETNAHQKSPSRLTREKALELFETEGRLLHQLEHPNLPQVFHFLIIGDEGYIIMTLVEGRSLADLLEENGGPFSEEQVKGWLLQVLDTLRYCHEKGVIHRDLKPDNLLLGNDGKIYLIDFGIAKALNPGQQMTSTGARILSPGYAPPEQYSNRESSADPRSDLYSLGATAYFLLTGEIPTEATDRMVGEPLPAPRSLNPAVSSRMEAFILKCLEIHKQDRPQSAAEANRLLQLEPIKTPTPQPTTEYNYQQYQQRDFFISYATEDEEYVRKLVEGLIKHGYSCWVAYKDIRPSENWRGAITRGLKNAKNFILILSRFSNVSEFVRREVDEADELKLPLFLVKLNNIDLSNDISWPFSGKQYIPAYNHPYIEKTIIDIIRGVSAPPLPPPTRPTDLPTRTTSISGTNTPVILGKDKPKEEPLKLPPLPDPESVSPSSAAIPIKKRLIIIAGVILSAFIIFFISHMVVTEISKIKPNLNLSPPFATEQYKKIHLTESVPTTSWHLTEAAITISPDCKTVGLTWESPIDWMTLVCVPAGEFEMGSISGDSDEQPTHKVFLNSYWIDKTEVTNAQYATCVQSGICNNPSSSRFSDPAYSGHPVVGIDWYDAVSYCSWAGRSLPTEAQWEKAARGIDGRIYPWGNEIPSSYLAKYYQGNEVAGTSLVGSILKGASPYGALDMTGNVSEWVADWYKEDYYSTFLSDEWPSNPTGPNSGTLRVIRGCGWNCESDLLRVANRFKYLPTHIDYYTGFRCVLNFAQ